MATNNGANMASSTRLSGCSLLCAYPFSSYLPRSLYNKEPEFRAWLVEERKINPETISKDQTKKEFARFVEDYNTGMSIFPSVSMPMSRLPLLLCSLTLTVRALATLPHEKFYHMEEYERRMAAMRAGEFIPPPNDTYDPTADLRALESSHKRRVVEQDTYMSKEQLQELRRVQNERIQVRLPCPFHTAGSGLRMLMVRHV